MSVYRLISELRGALLVALRGNNDLHNALKSSGTSPKLPSRLRHIAFNSSVERFKEFGRSGRGKSEADNLHTVYQHFFE